ncbi:hypothetical protein N7501_000270 [Penicillium viridicatum]|nr:hypothetical protein N7501_000270 [Penicillium viridicatum]
MYDSNQEMKYEFTKHAMHYKVACVQSLGASITAEQSSAFTDSTLAQVLTLALDELALGDFAMARNHIWGATRMVAVNGGPETLGLDGFLELLFRKFVDEVGLLSGATDQVPPASCAEVLRAHPVSSYV